MRILLANKQARLRAAYLGCAELALYHGASSRVIIPRRGGMLKDTATGYVSIQTVCFVLWANLYRAWT